MKSTIVSTNKPNDRQTIDTFFKLSKAETNKRILGVEYHREHLQRDEDCGHSWNWKLSLYLKDNQCHYTCLKERWTNTWGKIGCPDRKYDGNGTWTIINGDALLVRVEKSNPDDCKDPFDTSEGLCCKSKKIKSDTNASFHERIFTAEELELIDECRSFEECLCKNKMKFRYLYDEETMVSKL